MSRRKMPRQKPGESEQVVGTDPLFLAALARRFGPIRFDLAANASNAVAPNYYGPGSPLGEDTLVMPWHKHGGVLFLNPEFDDIEPYAAKCREEGALGGRVHFLVPASTGANWFRFHVNKHALILALSPRLTFVGHMQPYPKDMILAVFGPWVAPGFDCWRWRP